MQELDRSVTATGDIVVELKDVRKTFRQRQPAAGGGSLLTRLFSPTIREVRALDGVSLTVRRGEIVAYAGPNGAGKSTTIKMLSGMLVPDSGSVRALGLDPWRDRVGYVGRVGVVFGQRTELWWDHPISTCFEWKRVLWGIPQERYDRMVPLVKSLLGLDEFFGSLTRTLSLGQRMRADLALALLPEPEILFLDEPTIGLDVLARRSILQFIKELNRTRQLTVVVTSHDMVELEQLAGRIVLIDRGRIAFDGPFDRLRSEFANRRLVYLETGSEEPPSLTDATHIRSEAGRHEYLIDASRVRIPLLLEQASAQGPVLDVETHRASIDDLIADIYEKWQGQPPFIR